jgi:transcriptional regulator with XRE-family HTH domain
MSKDKMKFHTYLKELRTKRYKDTKKLCSMLGVNKDVWRKIERGINPPPQRTILKKFCLLVHALSYEQSQLFALARRWEPHEDTNTSNHTLISKESNSDWIEAIIEENQPDYEHKYWGQK